GATTDIVALRPSGTPRRESARTSQSPSRRSCTDNSSQMAPTGAPSDTTGGSTRSSIFQPSPSEASATATDAGRPATVTTAGVPRSSPSTHSSMATAYRASSFDPSASALATSMAGSTNSTQARRARMSGAPIAETLGQDLLIRLIDALFLHRHQILL